MNPRLAILASCVLAGAHAKMEILTGPHAGLVAETSRYQYYGPGDGAEMTAQALYLDGEDLCNPQASAVRGKIVVSDTDKSRCSFFEVYRAVANAGGVGFVRGIFYSPPGLTTFAHDEWDSSTQPKLPPLMLDVSDQDIDLKDADEALIWIGPPHNTEWETTYTSVAWMLFLRVQPALGGAWVTIKAVVEWQRREVLKTVRTREIGSLIYLIEGTCAFLLGVAYACGQWGPMVLPETAHFWFMSALTGPSLFSSMVLIFFMQEAIRDTGDQKPRHRPFWKTYKLRLWLGSIVVCLDLLLGVLRLMRLDQSQGGKLVWGIVAALFVVSSGVICSLFVYTARDTTFEMRKLMGDPSLAKVRKKKNMARICQVLYIIGTLLCLTGLSGVWFLVEVLRGVISVERISVHTWFAITVRLLVADRLIDAIHSREEPSTFDFFLGEARRWKNERLSTVAWLSSATIAPEPTADIHLVVPRSCGGEPPTMLQQERGDQDGGNFFDSNPEFAAASFSDEEEDEAVVAALGPADLYVGPHGRTMQVFKKHGGTTKLVRARCLGL